MQVRAIDHTAQNGLSVPRPVTRRRRLSEACASAFLIGLVGLATCGKQMRADSADPMVKFAATAAALCR